MLSFRRKTSKIEYWCSMRRLSFGFEEVDAKNLGDCLKQKGWTSTYGYHKAFLSNIKKRDALIYHLNDCDIDMNNSNKK